MSESAEKHILVVEDDTLVADVIAAALDETYPVVIVDTSAAALETLRQGSVRLLLLDCTLPGGIDADLLPQAERTGTPVILMSGDPSRGAQLSGKALPFVRKPFTLTGLLNTVEAVLADSEPT